MSNSADFLVELGSEELPPKALQTLSAAFTDGIQQGLSDAGLTFAEVTSYATPRRLAVKIADLPTRQPDRKVEKLGPPVKAARDADGNPSKAAAGFARSCGVEFAALETTDTDKGERLVWRSVVEGSETASLLPGIVQTSLDKLPIPKRMRWGDRDTQFVRPVHWLVMLLGNDVVEGEVLGLSAGRLSQGHRFHAPDPIELSSPNDYPGKLADANVIADFAERRSKVRGLVVSAGEQAGGESRLDEDLLDEVTALVEWPAPIIGSYDQRYLDMPDEVIISTIQDHQRYFPVVDSQGGLLPKFVTISNLESPQPELIVEGNERVVRPRLDDALFFWNQDRKKPLADRHADLGKVIFQKELGSQADKTARVQQLATQLAGAIGGDEALADRAALLSRCDLLSQVVYEIPELQGTMGRYYAEHDVEPAEVATAIEELYLPRFAGDRLPETQTGTAVALADRLDTLAGIFAIGKRPTGDKDPFALRRAALGILRICLEKGLQLDLAEWINRAVELQPVSNDEASNALLDFMRDRFRIMLRDGGAAADQIEATLAVGALIPSAVAARLTAVTDFLGSEAAQSLAAANKRIANILAKTSESDWQSDANADLVDDAELALQAEVDRSRENLAAPLAAADHAKVLNALAPLREPVDRFFDQVMVNCEDQALRLRRLTLLRDIRELFLSVADFSLLQQ